MKEGKLFVISGPSGTGKGTIISKVLQADQDICLSISCTTRPPRTGERDGVHYFFKTREEFEKMIGKGEFLEYAQVFGNYYGTPLFYVNEKRAAGMNVLLEIDVQGAMKVKEKMTDAVLIFIAPPSLEVLEHRLRLRNTETEEQIAKRSEGARRELAFKDRYDFVVVNDDLDTAVQDVLNIINERE